MNCKTVLKEVRIYGSKVEPEIINHIKNCPSCKKEYELYSGFDRLLQSMTPPDPPLNLKVVILDQISNTDKRHYKIPILDWAFKTALSLALIGFGFWLGILTANNQGRDEKILDYLAQNPAYDFNVAAVPMEGLGELYLQTVEEINE